jgi:hypothetical protein
LFPDGTGTFRSEENLDGKIAVQSTSGGPALDKPSPSDQKSTPHFEESNSFQPKAESNGQSTDRFIVKSRKDKAKHLLEELVDNGEQRQGEEKGERRKGSLGPEELRKLPGYVDVRIDDLLEAPPLVNP